MAYERIDIDILKKESRTEEFLNINPNGRVPVLEHDGKIISESNAIMWYLANGTGFLPYNIFEQSQVLQWMFFEQYSHEPFIATSRYWISILHEEEKYREQLKEKIRSGYAALEGMERHLKENDYFVSNKYSIADIALYAYTHVAEEGNFELSRYPRINTWLQRIEDQNGYINIKKS